MYELSERLIRLRKAAFDWKVTQKDYIGQRLYGALEGLVAAPITAPWMKKKSSMLASIIKFAEPIIKPDELIVGYNYYGDDSAINMELSLNPWNGMARKILLNYLEQGRLDEDQIEFICDVLEDIEYIVQQTNYILESPSEISSAMADAALWAVGTAENHTILDYEKVIKIGFKGISEEINVELDKLTWKDPKSIEKRLLLESMLEVAQSARKIGENYKNIVEKKHQNAQTVSDEKLTNDLQKMLTTLSISPEYPAETFQQAVQSFWFAHIINTWEDGINANSIGRLDQILFPYYKKDLAEGLITREGAMEILGCLWVKLYRDYDVQQMILGGTDSEGNDATNDLTYMMLEITQKLDFIRCLSVRVHKNTPNKLISDSLSVVAKGMGVPFFFNDDTMIPALVDNGITLEDARGYGAIGCVEITIPGKANPHAVSNRINLLKCLELSLNDGVSMVKKKQVGLKTGRLSEFKTIDDIILAYEKQVEYFMDLACFESNRMELINSTHKPMPYKSLLTEGCLNSGKDFNAGGSKYNFHESQCMGVPNVADSLAAIQQIVFDEKKITLEALVEQLKLDFPDEKIRQMCINRSPKYGNDNELADKYAVHVFTHFCTKLKEQKGVFHGGFLAQPFTYVWLIEAGEGTAATPDGRRKGDNLAYSLSPMQGRDIQGLTSMINSLSKFPYHLAAGGPSAIIEIDPLLFNESNFDSMCAVVKSAIDKGVGQMQFNVIDAETLKLAQNSPENYQNLMVRVSGYSSRFCTLDKKMQDHIIARTKHKE